MSADYFIGTPGICVLCWAEFRKILAKFRKIRQNWAQIWQKIYTSTTSRQHFDNNSTKLLQQFDNNSTTIRQQLGDHSVVWRKIHNNSTTSRQKIGESASFGEIRQISVKIRQNFDISTTIRPEIRHFNKIFDYTSTTIRQKVRHLPKLNKFRWNSAKTRQKFYTSTKFDEKSTNWRNYFITL